MNTKPRTDAIVEMADRPQGVLFSEVREAFKLNDRATASYLSRLTIAGRLVRLDAERWCNRWFAQAHHAAAWDAATPKRPPLRDRALALLQEVAGAGLVPTNIKMQLHTSTGAAKRVLEELTTEGAAHRGLRAGFGFRYFATARQRDAWLLAPRSGADHTTMVRPISGPKLVAVDQKIKSTARNSHGPCISLPGSLTAPSVRAQHKAYHAKPVKRTVCPNWTHDPRYQVGPGENFQRPFSSLPLGATLKGVQA